MKTNELYKDYVFTSQLLQHWMIKIQQNKLIKTIFANQNLDQIRGKAFKQRKKISEKIESTGWLAIRENTINEGSESC